MTRPTPAALAFARSTLPVRRVASGSQAGSRTQFASLLQHTAATHGRRSTSSAHLPTLLRRAALATPEGGAMYHAAMLPATTSAATPAAMVPGGPTPISRSDILNNAEQLMGIPYVWGGNAGGGLDCSAFVSKAWGISRHTTDSLASVATPIGKDELQAGDALNLTTGRDAEGTGHVRLFDRWANPEHTRMYVYEETPPKSIHHVINWDATYQPMRRMNLTDA